MTSRLRGFVVLTGAVALSIGLSIGLAAPSFGKPSATPFRHDLHADPAQLNGAKPPVEYSADKKSCNSSKCHAVDAQDRIVAPGANGHSPCSDANCHATWFMTAGMPSDKNYEMAASFCLGCHASDDGKPPKPSERVNAVFYSRESEVEFHVEMPGPAEDTQWGGQGSHFAHANKHATRADCRKCHSVDSSGLLTPGTPGHDQCLDCHKAADKKAGKVKVSMGDCSDCHKLGARKNPFDAAGLAVDSRQLDFGVNGTPKADKDHLPTVRACASESLDAANKLSDKNAQKNKVSCFRHDGGGTKKAHRFGADGKSETQCGHCHYMIADDTVWKQISGPGAKAPVQYYSLVDIRRQPIIANDNDNGHKGCGSTEGGCHRDSFGSNMCEKCHPSLSVF